MASVIFLHLPKTGGTTLSSIMSRQYARDAVYALGLPLDQAVANFRAMPEEHRARIELLHGHMPFGLHTFLPQPSTYVTMLRDPVSRALSEYQHVLRTVGHPLHEAVVSRELSLEDYVGSGIRGVDNRQTAFLAGVVPEETREAGGPEMLEQAREHLATHFAVVGLTEKFDESLLIMRSELEWEGPVYYVPLRLGIHSATAADLPLLTVQLIRDRNRNDIALQRFASTLLDTQISSQPPSFSAKVRKFRRANHGYGLLYRSRHGVVTTIRNWLGRSRDVAEAPATGDG
jgi:Sulfotransferase family